MWLIGQDKEGKRVNLFRKGQCIIRTTSCSDYKSCNRYFFLFLIRFQSDFPELFNALSVCRLKVLDAHLHATYSFEVSRDVAMWDVTPLHIATHTFISD